ncbi:MAG: hypothetical protein ACE5JB_13955, partial [bacterium]
MLLDATHGTQFSEINREYLKNLDHLFHGTDGSFNYPYYYRLGATLPLHLAAGDGWSLALMHPFARERVREMYTVFKKRHGRWNNDSTAKVTGAVIEFMDIGDYRLTDASQVSFGLVLASEVGDTSFAEGLWNYAFKKYHPTEKDGTRYFRKASLLLNSIFLLGGVNEEDGLWRLYNQGWPASHFLEPRVEEVNLDKVLVVRADYSKETGLTIGLKPRQHRTTQAEVSIVNLQPDMTYTLQREGQLVETFQMSTGSYSFTAKISKTTLFVVKPK